MEDNRMNYESFESLLFASLVRSNTELTKKVKKLSKQRSFLCILALPTMIRVCDALGNYIYEKFFNKPTVVEEQVEEEH